MSSRRNEQPEAAPSEGNSLEMVRITDFARDLERLLQAHPNRGTTFVAILLPPSEAVTIKYIDAKDNSGRRYIVALPEPQGSYHAMIKGWTELRALKGLKVEGGGFIKKTSQGFDLSGRSQAYGRARHEGVALAIEKAFPNQVITVEGRGFVPSASEEDVVALPISRIPPEIESVPFMERLAGRYPLAILRLERLVGRFRNGGNYGYEPNPITVLEERKELIRLKRLADKPSVKSLSGEALQNILEEVHGRAGRKLETLDSIAGALDKGGVFREAICGLLLYFRGLREERYQARRLLSYVLLNESREEPQSTLGELLKTHFLLNERNVREEALHVAS